MKQLPIKLGPLALLLTVISICLAILAILSLTTARADMRLAEKYAETVRVRYELEQQGQQFLLAPDPAELQRDENGVYWKTFEEGDTRLSIGLRPDGESGYQIVTWKTERDWTQNTSIGNLWAGG